MQKTYFISDAHLGLGTKEEERLKENRLIDFLEYIRNDASQVFIVGDLFDAWIEYRTVIPKGFHRLLAALNNITHKGILIHYLVGNHDYWIRDYFRDEIGMKTYLHPFDVTIDGKKIYIHHGDGLAANDSGYRILKRILRNPFSIMLFSWLHPDLGIKLARFSSQKSRGYTISKHYGEIDGMLKFAEDKIGNGYDIVIMGHRHQPTMQKIKDGLYINLGDWINSNTYAVMEQGKIELKEWGS